MGMLVTSTGPQTVQMAQGERVILGCAYTFEPGDTGDLDIEWSMISPDATQKDRLLLSYAGGIEYVHGTPDLTKGLDFATDDPSQGNASLTIASLSPAHSATYQCKVKKSPGVDMRKVSLVVMVRPSVPKCWLEGEAVKGEAVSLHCNSSQGSSPLSYAWTRDTGPVLATATQSHVTGGVLSISNHSETFAGVYACEVTNAVGSERCTIKLAANEPPNRTGAIIGTVVGCLLLTVIIAILIWLVLYKWESRVRRYEKEVSNDIREDVPAPDSRTHSRGTSLRSGVAYSQVGVSQSGRSDHTPIPSSGSGFIHDNTNGYAV
ncbi:hypothetical protein DPEC_G00336930 [Dallia pectoralis]|uniref:Uncharacterized protein n=1 Tax=Dallia pectoralis TaxID=75939 RepID=A0ACC2F7D2_DALPE|nr:hypothetical protein DPEC_G00336930 [Dallia pectoralis]